MDTIETILTQYLSIDPNYQILRKAVQTVVIVVGMLIIRAVLQRLLARQMKDADNRYRWHKVVQYVCDGMAVLLVISIWFQSGQSFATYFGLVSAGVAIALQDPIANIFAWLYIIYKNPFDVGDRIEIDGHKGDVVDTHFLEFTMLEVGGHWVDADQNTGRLVHVPNRTVFKQPLYNETQEWPFIWHEIPVTVTFESDWERAKHLVNEIMNKQVADVVQSADQYRKHRQKNHILMRHGHITPIVYTNVEASGIELTMRFLCEPRMRRTRTESIWEALLRQLPYEPQVHLAYPTNRMITSKPLPDTPAG